MTIHPYLRGSILQKISNSIFIDIYKRLYKVYGRQHWWPGDTRFEMMVGAILTQNTSWSNVEKAIRNLKKENALSSAEKLLRTNGRTLARLIRPSGYYNVKSKRLRDFAGFLVARYGGDLNMMSRRETGELREELLDVKGVGPETCDSMLLYALNRPVFVVDAYTRRIFSRHKLIDGNAGYHDIQRLFMVNLPADHRLYNEYHALIVRLGKELCRKNPSCERCPLNRLI
ncbi:MAG: endonuclease III domain-containing protein [Candidatus Omnitrophota bacterium]